MTAQATIPVNRKIATAKQRLRQRLAKDLRIGVAIKADDAAYLGLVAQVNQVVAAAQELIQIKSILAARCIFAHGGQIGSGLAVQ